MAKVRITEDDGAHRSSFLRTVYYDSGYPDTPLVKVAGRWYYLDKEDGRWVADRVAYPDRPSQKKTNPGRSVTKRPKKGALSKRIPAALTTWLRKTNPGMRSATAVRVKKLKGGGVTITPAR